MNSGVASTKLASLANLPCPLCGDRDHVPWGSENGFSCVRCRGCGLLYVNPRPPAEHIDQAVQLGVHASEQVSMNVIGSRAGWKVSSFQSALRLLMPDLSKAAKPIRWLDVGAGFGEMVEAVRGLAPHGSVVEGIEPMRPKAEAAQRRGVPVRPIYLDAVQGRWDAISLIDVFSHIPDFHGFLRDVRTLLAPEGELILKTGNAADLERRSEFPGPLTLPDHLTFGGRRQLERFLTEGGFEVKSVVALRVDGVRYSARNFVKWLLRRPVHLSLPYTSRARVLWIRARRRG